MACSEARIAANRANALKSTGPKTDEGKEASRRNALKHGMTGAGMVIPGEDAEAIEREAAGFLRELAPDGLPTARVLAGRVALLSVRMRRCARHESAATALRCRLVADEFDEVRREEAERLFAAIDEGTNRDELLAMPEGVDLLDAELAGLRAVAIAAATSPGRWSRDDSARLARCLPPEARPHAEAVGRALSDGDLSGLDRGIVAVIDPARVRTLWASDQVVGLVDAERADLASIRAGLDHEGVARLREEAVDRALIGDEPETQRARRYEAATTREFYRALRELRELRKPAPAAPAIEPPPPGMSSPETAELVRQTAELRRQFARAEAAPVAAATPPLGSFCPGDVRASAAGHGSAMDDAKPAPHGRSRYEDKRKRPKLGR